MGKEESGEKLRLIGLDLGVTDNTDSGWINYDIGRIVYCALEALQVAVLAMEQIVTKEKWVNSLDVGDFYNYLASALEVENGQGVMSEPGSMSSLQDEIQGLINIVQKARRIAKQPPENSRLRVTTCVYCDGSGVIPKKRRLANDQVIDATKGIATDEKE